MSRAMQDLYVDVRLILCCVHLLRHFTPTLLSCLLPHRHHLVLAKHTHLQVSFLKKYHLISAYLSSHLYLTTQLIICSYI